MAEEEVTVLNLLRASVAAPGFAALIEVGRDVGRVVEVRVVEVEVVAGFVAGLAVVVEDSVLGRVVVVFFSVAEEPATLDLRSKVEVVGFVGALVDGVPARDMRLAVPEIPFFSSLELATDRPFSSAELLTDARERWDVAELRGLRAVLVLGAVVEVGRVGGLPNVLPLVEVRADAVVGLEAEDMEVGRLVELVEPDKGRLVVLDAVVLEGDALVGEVLVFSLSLVPSGLVIGPSLPDMTVESTGVAGGAFSVSVSAAGGGGGTGSSVEAMVY